MCNLKFQSQTDRHHRLWCVFQNNNITSNIFVTRAASDRQFLKNKNDKSKLRKYLTKNYSSLNQSHDGWLQNTLMILIIDAAIFFFDLQTYAADIFFAQEHSYSWPAAFSWYISSIFILLHCWNNILQIHILLKKKLHIRLKVLSWVRSSE